MTRLLATVAMTVLLGSALIHAQETNNAPTEPTTTETTPTATTTPSTTPAPDPNTVSIATKPPLVSLTVTLNGMEVPLEMVKEIPGQLIATLKMNGVPEPVITEWLHNFDWMAPSQCLGVFLFLSHFNESKRAHLDDVGTHLNLSPAGLTKYLSPIEFVSQVHKLGDSMTTPDWTRDDIVHVVSKLPKGALMSWLEAILEKTNGTFTKEFFEEDPTDPSTDGSLAILGLTCAQVSKLPTADVFFYLSKYNTVAAKRIVPFSLLQCFKNKVAEALRNAPTPSDVLPATLLDRINEVDLPKIGRRVLATFSAKNFTMMAKRDLLGKSLKEIGKLSMFDVIVSMSRSKFVELSAAFNGLEMKLTDLGSFVHATAEELGNALAEEVHQVLRDLWVKRGQLTLCMPEEVRKSWMFGLESVFGRVRTWTSSTLLTIGDLLIALKPVDWEQLSAKQLRIAAPKLIANTGYFAKYDERPSYTNETVFYKVCEHWLGEDNNEGEKFSASHFLMMRNLLLASQLTINVNNPANVDLVKGNIRDTPAADGMRRRRRHTGSPFSPLPTSLFEDLLGSPSSEELSFRIHKRQTSTPVKLGLIGTYYSESIRLVNKRLTTGLLSLKQKNEITKYRVSYIEKAAAFVKTELGVAETPLNNFIQLFNDAVNKKLISQEKARQIREQVFIFRLEFLRGMAKAVDFHPEDFPVALSGDLDQFCLYIKESSFCKIVRVEVEPETEEEKETLPEKAFCDGLKMAGVDVSSVSLTKEDLVQWNKDELEGCLGELGLLHLPLHLKRSIWEMILEKKVEISEAGHYKLRNLLEGMLYDDNFNKELFFSENSTVADIFGLSKLNASHLENLSLLGKHTYPKAILEFVADKIIENTNGVFPADETVKDFRLKNVLAFGSMGHLVCGFRAEVISKVMQDDVVAETLIPIYGRLKKCPNMEVLQVLANKAEHLYGSAANWTASTVRNLGIIIAGLSKPELLPIESFAAIDATAFAHADGELFAALSIRHVKAFPVDALTSIDVTHFRRLSNAFKDTVMRLKDSFPSERLFNLVEGYKGLWKEGVEKEQRERMKEAALQSSADSVTVSIVVPVVLFALVKLL